MKCLFFVDKDTKTVILLKFVLDQGLPMKGNQIRVCFIISFSSVFHLRNLLVYKTHSVGENNRYFSPPPKKRAITGELHHTCKMLLFSFLLFGFSRPSFSVVLWRSACLCLPSTGLKVCHHCRAAKISLRINLKDFIFLTAFQDRISL